MKIKARQSSGAVKLCCYIRWCKLVTPTRAAFILTKLYLQIAVEWMLSGFLSLDLSKRKQQEPSILLAILLVLSMYICTHHSIVNPSPVLLHVRCSGYNPLANVFTTFTWRYSPFFTHCRQFIHHHNNVTKGTNTQLAYTDHTRRYNSARDEFDSILNYHGTWLPTHNIHMRECLILE